MLKEKFKSFIICIVISLCIIVSECNEGKIGEFLSSRIETMSNATIEMVDKRVLKLTGPIKSIYCNQTNADRIIIYKHAEDYIYMLSENELMAIDINEKEARFLFVGTFLHMSEAAIEFQVQNWRNKIVVVMRTSTSLQVYLTSSDFKTVANLETVQKININVPTSNKYVLFRNGEDLFMVTYEIRTDSANKLILYKWRATFFTNESEESADLPSKSDLFVYNTNTTEPLVILIGIGEINQIIVLKILHKRNKWKKLQRMQFKRSFIKCIVNKGNLYMIGCSTETYCAIYKWTNSQFRRYQKLSSQIQEKIKDIKFGHDIIVMENNERMMSFYTSPDFIGLRSALSRVNSLDHFDFTLFKMSTSQNLYFVDFLFNKTSFEINFYDVSEEHSKAISSERSNSASSPKPLKCVTNLKTILKNRILMVQSVKSSGQKLANQNKSLQLDKIRKIIANLINIKDVKVGIVQMPYHVNLSAKKLEMEVINTNIETELARKLLKEHSTIDDRANEKDGLQTIAIESLEYKGKNTMFQNNMFRNHPKIMFEDDIKLNTIAAKEINVKSDQINSIKLKLIVLASSPNIIGGLKVIKNLKADRLKVSKAFNNLPVDFLRLPSSNSQEIKQLVKGIEFKGDITVKNLNVTFLNGFNLSALLDNNFVVNDRNVIKGILLLQNITNVNKLYAERIGSSNVAHLMTTSTDQLLHTDLFINKIFSTNLQADKINNENLHETVALANVFNKVEVPTQFNKINILRNLNIEDSETNDERNHAEILEVIENMKRHVIGTKTSDLSQIYNGRVIIRGTVNIKDADTFSLKTRILMNSIEIPRSIPENYWMININQDIPVDRFLITSERIKTRNVMTLLLNQHFVKDLILLNAKDLPRSVNLRFEDVYSKENLFGHADNFLVSIPYSLNQTIARIRNRNSEFIISPIEFKGNAKIRHLTTNDINGIINQNLVDKSHSRIKFEALQNVGNMHVTVLKVEDHLNASTFNNANLQMTSERMAKIDEPIDLESQHLSAFEAVNMSVVFFEDFLFHDFIEELTKKFKGLDKQVKNVKISGEIEYLENVFLDSINEKINFNDMLHHVVRKNQTALDVKGNKSFRDNLVVIDGIKSKQANELVIDRVLYHTLSRSKPQAIEGNVFAKRLSIKNVDAAIVNNVDYNQIIDRMILHNPIRANIRVKFLNSTHIKSRTSSFAIQQLMKLFHFPMRNSWNSIESTEMVKVSIQKSTFLDRLMTIAVNKFDETQIITGSFQVNSHKFYIKKLVKTDNFLISNQNPINLIKLYHDSVKTNTQDPQILIGIKTFLVPFYADYAVIGKSSFLISKRVNNLDIVYLNNTILRPIDVITVTKTFLSLKVENIVISDNLNGLPLSSFFPLANVQQLLSKLWLTSLEVFNLKTYTFNEYSLPHFLQDRMRKFDGMEQEVSGLLTFTSLDLTDDIMMSSINGVMIEDMIFDQSDHLQDVTGHKTVRVIKLIGPSIIKSINNVDFTDFLKKTISKHQKRTIESVKLPSTELREGLHVKRYLNGHHIEELLTSDFHVPKLDNLVTLMSQISDLNNNENLGSVKAKRLLYIDYDPEVSISYENPQRYGNRCSGNVIYPIKFKTAVLREKRDSEMIVEIPSMSITVKPNLKCRHTMVHSKEIELWWTYKVNPNATIMRNFSFSNDISDIKFLEHNKTNIFMILTMQNDIDLTSEIFVLQLAINENDWYESQGRLIGLNYVTYSLIVSLPQQQFLVVSSFNGTTISDFVSIYLFNDKLNKFVKGQKDIEGDKFDILLSINVAPKIFVQRTTTFLLLSREKSKIFFIYRLKMSSNEFIFQRKFLFESEILEIVVLYINNENPFFIVSFVTGDFCLYEWRGIENWKVKQCGHFSNINSIKSYEYLKRHHLLLTSSLNAGTALTVYRQGDFF
ncbi:CLUMA_CG015260, isoform A [Clunio marinus]|uniref:CLUMA_CG015260, isoform A n=1 Tax=Clunio marinus TaxID=568069 RepID=A0A1J1IVE8_9DIPT|nr:CLUMA_CG015260, isoform A [Clunio marinus]